jgi:hypothetical protein
MTYPVDCTPCLGVQSIAAIRLPGCDVGEALVSAGVDPRVQESECGLASAKARVVEKCDDGSGDLSELSLRFFVTTPLKCEHTGEAAEVPPLGVRTPP